MFVLINQNKGLKVFTIDKFVDVYTLLRMPLRFLRTGKEI
ncbi:MAG: hypothetical protein JWQ28_2905 [Pedobacter sp.]|nr:hypothetical protein [Pedobacter sp.]